MEIIATIALKQVLKQYQSEVQAENKPGTTSALDLSKQGASCPSKDSEITSMAQLDGSEQRVCNTLEPFRVFMSIADAVQEWWGWTRQCMGLDPPEDKLLKELRRRLRIKVWEMQVREEMERRAHDERMRCEQLHQTILAQALESHRGRSHLVQVQRGQSAILIQRAFQRWSVTRHAAAIRIQHAFRRLCQAETTQQSIISRLDVQDAATSERPLNVSVSASAEHRLTRIQAVMRGAAARAVYHRKRSACLRIQRSWRHVGALDLLGLKLLQQNKELPILLIVADSPDDELREEEFAAEEKWHALQQAPAFIHPWPQWSASGFETRRLTLARIAGCVGVGPLTIAESLEVKESVIAATKIVGGAFYRKHFQPALNSLGWDVTNAPARGGSS